MLIEGDDSLPPPELVQSGGMTGNVNGGINLLGNAMTTMGRCCSSPTSCMTIDPTRTPSCRRWMDDRTFTLEAGDQNSLTARCEAAFRFCTTPSEARVDSGW